MTIKEVAMFSRTVSMQLKPNCVEEFSRTVEKQIIPLLRKQAGFQDLLAFVVPGGMAATGISLWYQKEDAERYSRQIYPTVLKALKYVVEGTPDVLTCEVCNSTFHKVPAYIAA
jgi:hypothetical protein